MNKKLLLIIGGITLFILLILLVLNLFGKEKTPTVKNGIIPTATLVPTITPKPTDLFITNILPPPNPKEAYLSIQKITITFSEEVEPGSLKYEISPKTDVLVRNGVDKRTLYIVPRSKWEMGETTVVILQTTRSVKGRALYLPSIYKMVVDIPPAPELNSTAP